jgi:hypothetical protein
MDWGILVRPPDKFEQETDKDPPAGAEPPAPATVPGEGELLGLQRWAGNRAVTSLLQGTADGAATLEGAADAVAHQHAEPLVREHGWFGQPGGLDAGHAVRAVGERLGADLGDVTIRPGRLPGAPASALASVQDGVVHLPPGGFDPGTPVGQALLAHELTHVVQQSADTALPAGPGPAHADRRRPAGIAPAGMAQHSISCKSGDQSSPAVATTFADVEKVYSDSTDAAARSTALTAGITTARANASRLFRNADKPPVSTLRQQYETETGADVPDNPHIGVSQDDVERAYRAWAENPGSSEPPWVLLAVWTKEGIGAEKPEQRFPGGLPANSAADAKAIYRSMAYFVNFGADVYVSHTAVAGGDNTTDFAAGTGAAHDAAFRGQITRQVTAGRLPRDISGEIDATLTVTPAGPGLFQVAAAPRFAELSLMLVDAFYREQKDALAADPRVGADPDPGLVYMRWNMRASSFDDFLNRVPNTDPDGSTPSRTDWAFHRPMPDSEYGQSRRNAMRFKYLLEIFQHTYQDKS